MIKRILLLAVLLCVSSPAHADFKDVDKMTDEEAMDYFVDNGAGYFSSVDVEDSAEWIDVKVRGPLPDHFDLRTLHPSGHLQPIKKQRCGDCWAHSVLAAFESKWALAHPKEPFTQYAQQELISSCPSTGGSCNGGGFGAFDYTVGKSGPGVPLESEMPYHGHGSSCDDSVEKTPRAISWAFVGNQKSGRSPSIEQMKQALMDYGSLSVTVHAFHVSGSDVYKSCSGGGTNHMVNIEGWQDDASVQGGGYWIMRNSWGKSFGENGYAKVAYTNRSGGKCSRLGERTAVITKLN